MTLRQKLVAKLRYSISILSTSFPAIRKMRYCSKTSLTGESQFQKCGCIPGTHTAAPLGGKQMVNPLDQ
jgi:hypothetical protein